MNYTLRQLRTFVAVARQRSFSQAGQLIGLSQSAVSHSVKELEAEIGVRLLDRTTREVLLTGAGQQLATRLTRLLEELNTTLLDVRSYGEPSAHLMPQCLASTQQHYPDIRVILHDRVQQAVLQSVRNAEVDFGIVIGPLGDAEFDAEEILQEPFLLLCHQNDALAQTETVTWAMLTDRNMVLQDYASGSRMLVDAILQQLAIGVNVVQEIGHPATLYPMVEAGIGISILPALALPLPSGRKLVVRRLYPEMNRSLMLIKRKNRSLTPAAEAVWQEVRQQAALLTHNRSLYPAF